MCCGDRLRSPSKADIERFSVCTDREAFDPKATWQRRPSALQDQHATDGKAS